MKTVNQYKSQNTVPPTSWLATTTERLINSSKYMAGIREYKLMYDSNINLNHHKTKK